MHAAASGVQLDHPLAAERIRRALPRAKLIVQLRNPVERAYSDYCMLLRRGEVGADITTLLDPRQASRSRFLDGGRYHEHLARFLKRFPRENLLILFYEDLAAQPERTVGAALGYLGLSVQGAPVIVRERAEAAEEAK